VSFVIAVETMPVLTLVAVTMTPGINALEASSTVPLIVPYVDCPHTGTATAINAKTRSLRILIVIISFLRNLARMTHTPAPHDCLRWTKWHASNIVIEDYLRQELEVKII